MHTVKITEKNKKLIQVGSKLKRVKNHKIHLRIGQIYTVCHVDDYRYMVKDRDNDHVQIDLENFELVLNKTYGLWI